jgi:hypothetical protein
MQGDDHSHCGKPLKVLNGARSTEDKEAGERRKECVWIDILFNHSSVDGYMAFSTLWWMMLV